MKAESCSEAAITAFKASYEKLISGESPYIAESAIEAASDDKVPSYEALKESIEVDETLLSKVRVTGC